MSEISSEIGETIRHFRKSKGITLEELGKQIRRSKSTIQKYEAGKIVIDIETFYEIAHALNIYPEQLLYSESKYFMEPELHNPKTLFKESTALYSYMYDGRINKLLRSIFIISNNAEHGKFPTAFYMNIPSFDKYMFAENTYFGYSQHHDTFTSMFLTHTSTEVENVSITILSTFQETSERWGMMSGISFRPFMPVSFKMLFSRTPLQEDEELIKRLKISQNDIRMMKLFNMFNIM
jgi:transcriptional regulator with XRE-family HTH domain